MDSIENGLANAVVPAQRMELMGRVRMAEWIQMPEGQFAKEVEDLEKDALFRKLLFGVDGYSVPIGRARWPRSSLSHGDFYELTRRNPASGERVQVEEKLEQDGDLPAIIRKIGCEAFERYFVYGEEALPLDEIARLTGIEPAEARRVHDLLLELGVQAQFSGPPAASAPAPAPVCIAAVSVDRGEPFFQFLSPHWARGRYAIHYDALELWKHGGLLSAPELKGLPRLLRRIETINLRQSTLFRIFEHVVRLQEPYFKSRREAHKLPLSLRKLASHLDLAPSTICRAVAGRSVRLPWGPEIPIIGLLPGQRKVLRAILSRWLEKGRFSDKQLGQRLKAEHGIQISRRTVNTVRHEVAAKAI